MSDSTSESLLDLSAPRTVVLNDRGRSFTLSCRRVTAGDWEKYFSGITVTSQQDGRERINVTDINSPRLALAESVLIGATGYTVEGGGELAEIENWQKRIPLAHRLKLGEILADCRPAKSMDFVIHPEGEVVMLDATWSAAADGRTMQRFEGLKHVFQTPTEEQHRRYSRESSRSTVVGGSRTGKTIYRGAQLLLAALYDELIVRVEGYAVDAVELVGPGTAARDMDMLHKVMAAQELFQPQDTAVVAEDDTE